MPLPRSEQPKNQQKTVLRTLRASTTASRCRYGDAYYEASQILQSRVAIMLPKNRFREAQITPVAGPPTADPSRKRDIFARLRWLYSIHHPAASRRPDPATGDRRGTDLSNLPRFLVGEDVDPSDPCTTSRIRSRHSWRSVCSRSPSTTRLPLTISRTKLVLATPPMNTVADARVWIAVDGARSEVGPRYAPNERP